MPRGSFSRTVARAAASGGSRNYRARRPHAWYALLAVIVLGGVFLVGYSRNENLHPKTAASEGPGKSANWNVAFAIDICGKLEPDLPVSSNIATTGIRTFGKGLINIDPAVSSTPKDFEGANATLANFVLNYTGLTLTETAIKYPGASKTWTNGDACTGPLHGKGTLVAKVWSSPTAAGKLHSGSLLSIHFENDQMITVAFVPKGASIPKPPSKSQLASA